MLGLLRGLWNRSEGAAAVEFALVCIPLLIITIGIMEFAFALFQWNSAEKATQMGARVAIVSTPVAGGLNTFDGLTASNAPGDEPPDNFVQTAGSPVICTGDGTTGNCTNTKSGGTYTGTYQGAVHTRIVNRMRTVFPRIRAENVVVEYSYIGLGFAARPCGPVPSVTVRLQNMTFDFIVIDALLTVLAGPFAASLTMPPFAASMIGEDLNTAGTGCL